MSLVKKCIPDAYYASIFDIPYDDLKRQGIKALFFDLDNTLIGYDQDGLSKREFDFIDHLEQDFRVVIMSNSGFKRVSSALQDRHETFIWHAKKPLRSGFKKALEYSHTSLDHAVMIGDQLMTDVFGAKRTGIKAILVGSVKRSSDRKLTKMNRKIEAFVLKKIKKKYPELYEERLALYVSQHAL